MRKVISIVCSVVLCMSIVLASVGQVSALENADVANREEQISALFDEMTESLALSLLNEAIADESSVSSQAAVQEDLADIDEQLAELGVRQVEGDELAEILNRESVHSPVAPQASKPIGTNTANSIFAAMMAHIQKLSSMFLLQCLAPVKSCNPAS